MKLKVEKYLVPIYNENIIGKNKQLHNTSNSDFFNNKLDVCIDDEFNIILIFIGPGSRNGIKDSINKTLNNVDVFSKTDLEKIHSRNWFFYFECYDDRYDKIRERINIFLLASRIFKNADIGVKHYICITNPIHSEKMNDDWGYSTASFKEKKNENIDPILETDLNLIIQGYKKLLEFNNINFLTQHAVQFLFLSYTSYYYLESFILLMTSLETLVTPSYISDTLTNDIIKRVVGFIDNQKISSKTKFDKIYKFRSNIIHGRIKAENDLNKELKHFNSLQTITLYFYRKLLFEIDFVKVYKTSDTKDKYFIKLLEKSRNKRDTNAEINLTSNLRIYSKIKV